MTRDRCRLTSSGWLGGHPVAFRFVHITLSQGRKVGMVGRRREPGLRPWLKVIVTCQATG
ncbi:hypothetical protein EDD35_4683 [Amycolatopsis thermoflava]|uniref:Uncharacterized protein n=1 Tax=Amycolatopsis thermoflava TaxID=84480 RepID=A0A3N2H0D0_9PSEU|nr:hypothetical protein EDD35_4683 [Amycolatopsis thermoflava]